MEHPTIKFRIERNDDLCTMKALIKHASESGQRKDPVTDEPMPANFIQEVVCEHNGTPVLTAEWGVGVSTNPFLSFQFRGAKAGDRFKLSWRDNNGVSDSAETTIL